MLSISKKLKPEKTIFISLSHVLCLLPDRVFDNKLCCVALFVIYANNFYLFRARIMIMNSFEVCLQLAFILCVTEQSVMKLPGNESETTTN